jgi:transcriptional regulator with XRE-family HTH domain
LHAPCRAFATGIESAISTVRRVLLKQEVIGQHVRRLRRRAGLAARALGRRTGFSASFISQLENGLVSPSIGSMQKIAAALGVTLGEFFTAAGEGASGTIVRAHERSRFASDWSAATLESAGMDRRLEATVVHLAPSGRSGRHPHGHTSAEDYAFVLKGPVGLTLGPDRHVLRTGDAVCFQPGELRLWDNPCRTVARLLFISVRG